jgi:flagellar biosynthesis/type III secretory pathway protein FliH
MMRDAREEGLKEGREEGREEALRQAVMDIIAARFPRVVRLAKGILPTIDTSSVLRSLVIKMSTAQTAAEAREHLLAVVEADEEQDEE